MFHKGKGMTFWARTLEQARQHDGWMVIPRTYSYKTARQLACDLRRAHLRSTVDIAGLKPGEKWEATWQAPHDESKKYNCTVSIRLVESIPVH